MKFPIKWHKDCLANMRQTAIAYKEEAERAIQRADTIERNCMEYDAQIIEAEMRGVPEFDRDKFGIRKRK